MQYYTTQYKKKTIRELFKLGQFYQTDMLGSRASDVAYLAYAVCVHRALGYQEEPRWAYGAPLTARPLTAEVAVLVCSTHCAPQRWPAHLHHAGLHVHLLRSIRRRQGMRPLLTPANGLGLGPHLSVGGSEGELVERVLQQVELGLDLHQQLLRAPLLVQDVLLLGQQRALLLREATLQVGHLCLLHPQLLHQTLLALGHVQLQHQRILRRDLIGAC